MDSLDSPPEKLATLERRQWGEKTVGGERESMLILLHCNVLT